MKYLKNLGLALLAVGAFVIFILTGWGPQILAERLAPPPYPHSQIIYDRAGFGGNTYDCRRRLYQTADRIERVLAYMESYVPGFKQMNDSPLTYANLLEDRSWLAERFSAKGDVLPSLTIWLTALERGQTEIQVETCWEEV